MADSKIEKENVKVYYSKRFAKDFKIATKLNENFPDALDDLIDVLKMGDIRRFQFFNMPKLCKGFMVLEDKSLCIKGARGTGGGYRPVHSYYNHNILFVRGFPKNEKEKLTHDEAKSVCKILQTVKNGTCEGVFKQLTKPNSRSIIDDCDDENDS